MRNKIDIAAELTAYEWHDARWTHDKLIASSPFRYDNRASFFVDLETGGWHDSGATDSEWASGNFAKLLAFLRNETCEEAEDYLRWKYYEEWDGDTDKLDLSISLPEQKERIGPLDMSILKPFLFRHPYLGRRGISEQVQRKMRIGYCKRSRAVTIPWFTADGRLANVKYRKTDSKIFWYQKGGMPLRDLVYGMDIVYKERSRTAVIVEGEVDAMYLMTAGFAAIAIGGSAFTRNKAELIKRSPIERLIISTDNDAVGYRLKMDIANELCGKLDILESTIPKKYKDPNSVDKISEIIKYHQETKRISKSFELGVTL